MYKNIQVLLVCIEIKINYKSSLFLFYDQIKKTMLISIKSFVEVILKKCNFFIQINHVILFNNVLNLPIKIKANFISKILKIIKL